jgi:hypothetical protein
MTGWNTDLTAKEGRYSIPYTLDGVDSNTMRAPYQAIKTYGLIGNLRSAALVRTDGSIDRYSLTPFFGTASAP